MYKFSKTPEKNSEYYKATIEYSVDAIAADDILQEVYFFLLGCGFHNNSIIDSMADLVEKYREEEKEEDEE